MVRGSPTATNVVISHAGMSVSQIGRSAFDRLGGASWWVLTVFSFRQDAQFGQEFLAGHPLGGDTRTTAQEVRGTVADTLTGHGRLESGSQRHAPTLRRGSSKRIFLFSAEMVT